MLWHDRSQQRGSTKYKRAIMVRPSTRLCAWRDRWRGGQARRPPRLTQRKHKHTHTTNTRKLITKLTVDGAARVRVSVRGVIDGAAAKLVGLLIAQIEPIASVQNAVRVRAARAH